MNNKGFAVSTILYGLSIMGFLIVLVLIGLMASNRSNTKDFVMQVEDELNRFSSKQTEIMNNGNTNYPQEYFTLDGTNDYWYKIELWNGKTYTSATYRITPNTLIFFYIGNGGDIPTIACIDGESRANCEPTGPNLILSTTGDSSGGTIRQNSDAEGEGDNRAVYASDPQNGYTFTDTHYDQKVRVSMSSMDITGSYLPSPSSEVAGVFYIKTGNDFYKSDSSCHITATPFTGNQDQQWTVIGGTKINAKYKDCSSTSISGNFYNALF
ncbi:MAG: hypothetical protein IIZ67_03610 [Bacilli bacterium]|nr:hypothetical protein [Bacilli bacterium]